MSISQSSARAMYAQQKKGAKYRGIEFKLTFEQWREIWGDKLEQCGVRSWQLGMCRIGDRGAYEVGNVYLGTPARNAASRRMALENKRASESCNAHFVPVETRDYEESEEESDEEYISRKMGMRSASIFR